MSDLAPFVAAVLRDKTIQELQQENQALKEEIRNSKKIQIVGPAPANDDSPEDTVVVYHEAHFGEDGEPHENPNLWKVNFPSGQETAANYPTCPLSQLANLEILLGGATRSSFRDSNGFDCYLNDGPNDYDDELMIHVFFGGSERVWLTMGVHGWPISQRDLDVHPNDALEYLTETVAHLQPAKTVSFKCISFVVSGVRGLIEDLPAEKRASMENTDEARQAHELLGTVTRRLREAGNEVSAQNMSRQASEMVEALSFFNIFYTGPYFEEMIAVLIPLQRRIEREQGDEESFVEHVRLISQQVGHQVEDQQDEEDDNDAT